MINPIDDTHDYVNELEELTEKWRKLLYQAPILQNIEPFDFEQWIDNYNLWFEKVTRALDGEHNWKLELVFSKISKKKKIITLDVDATEEWADNILDALVLGFEKKGFTVGGGMLRVFDE